jgi:spermidine synthase
MSGEAYHLIPLGAVILFFYALSLLLVHFSVIPRQQNRRFWNFLLLFFFISTALLGLILVVKINYKLDISWIEEALQWHVDCGIGFALVAIFHLLWNLQYYTRRQGQEPERLPDPETNAFKPIPFTAGQYSIFFFLLGFISMMAQLVLLRENIKSFHGNELVIGIFLAIWMILTALGSQAGNNYRLAISQDRLYGLLVLLGALPILIHILLILEKRFFFLPGYQVGVLEMTISILLLTVLFTGVSGFLFGYVSKIRGEHASRSSAYRLDALGSLAAGLLFSLILVHLLNNLQQLTLLFLITALLVLWIYKYPEGRTMKWMLSLAGAIMLALSLMPGIVNKVEGLRYRQEQILQIKDTPHGNLTFTSRNNQITGYMDGNPVLSTADLTRAEEAVHFPALQHHAPQSFLLMGGGLTGHISEAMKYGPERIDYCEADPWIYRLGRTYFPETTSESLHFIPKDGRSWLMKAGDSRYDVVISTAGDPLTIGWNRYFTLEFYKLVKRHLNPDGVFCMKLSTGGNYVNDEGSALLGINYHTLKQVFSHVVIVPGTSTYFIASELPLSLDFPSLVDKHQISTTYVHPDYLDAMQLLFDSEQLSERIQDEEALLNKDLRPSLFFASLTGLQSRMGQHALGISGILAVLILVVLWFLYNPVKTSMYVSGFTGAGIQMVLIMVMQSFYGFAYLVAPLMITIFMGGIVLGTLSWQRIWKEASIQRLMGLVGLLALISALGFLLLKAETLFHSGLPGQLILGFLNLITGIQVGALFAMAVNLKGNSERYNPGILYSADLTGAALGTILPVVFLLPLIGVMNTFILFCAINLITALRLMLNAKKRSNG